MRRLGNILLWSAISAAFIGPGTVTTAASAGARFELRLLWALLFSTLACVVLQEASARLTVASGRTLGQALLEHFGRGPAVGVVSAVVLGCVAYEAGNILGATAGARLVLPWSSSTVGLAVGLIAAVLLWSTSPVRVARGLGVVVAFMGVAFLASAILLKPALGAIAKGALIPTFPADSSSIVLGLIGTTVVPYNLFLGSGLARGQSLRDMRLGLAIAVGAGGLISMAVLVTGTAIAGNFDFLSLSNALEQRLGSWSAFVFAFGLFCAGLSSAVTAPLAATLAIRSVRRERDDASWQSGGRRYRGVWLGALVIGVLFAVLGVRPVPAIVLAQALNGLLLPVVAIFLLIATNDRALMGERELNGTLANIAIGSATLVALLLGLRGLLRAAFTVLALPSPGELLLFTLTLLCAGGLAFPVVRAVQKRRRYIPACPETSPD